MLLMSTSVHSGDITLTSNGILARCTLDVLTIVL